MNRLLIIDAHAYAYRAFHAIRDLRSPEGKPTNAIYGFIKMLEKMRLAVQPTHMIAVWDGGLSGERKKLLPEYKAQRPEMPDDLASQLDEIIAWLMAAQIASFCGEEIEADDYIACLARRAAGEGWQTIIASADKDFMQLVSERVGLLNPNDKSGQVWGREQVLAKAGVEPEQIADWLALMGDNVDNISGVPGVGPKTAAQLLQQFGSIKTLLERLQEVKSEKLRAALQSATGILTRNLELVRLHEVPCAFAPERLVPGGGNKQALRELFSRWGFRGMLAELESGLLAEQQAELM